LRLVLWSNALFGRRLAAALTVQPYMALAAIGLRFRDRRPLSIDFSSIRGAPQYIIQADF
jgi:hypothetical protein